MSTQDVMDFSQPEPPAGSSPPGQALWWLKKGDLKLGPEWEKAHMICQSAEGDPAHDWVHALCHLIEEDFGNAAYWFRRAGRPTNSRDASALWVEMSETLQVTGSN